jgi:hypothetical protein
MHAQLDEGMIRLMKQINQDKKVQKEEYLAASYFNTMNCRLPFWRQRLPIIDGQHEYRMFETRVKGIINRLIHMDVNANQFDIQHVKTIRYAIVATLQTISYRRNINFSIEELMVGDLKEVLACLLIAVDMDFDVGFYRKGSPSYMLFG